MSAPEEQEEVLRTGLRALGQGRWSTHALHIFGRCHGYVTTSLDTLPYVLSSCVSQVLLALVLLSWSYVIYASRTASHWLLEKSPAPLQQD